MNAFEQLGLEARLVLTEEEVREAFRKKAGEQHPDSGGDEAEFSALQAAQGSLLSPSKRLREWLQVRGEELDTRGQIEAGLMELFQEVAAVGSQAEAAIKLNGKSQSALAKAMAEVQLMGQREKVRDLLVVIDEAIQKRVGRFGEIEEEPERGDAARVVRDLLFLEKWRGTLKGLYGRLL